LDFKFGRWKIMKNQKSGSPACQRPTPAHGRMSQLAHAHTCAEMPWLLGHRPPPHVNAVGGPLSGFPCRPRALLPLPYPLCCVKVKAKFHVPRCSSPSPSLRSSCRYSVAAHRHEPPPSSSQSSSARSRAGAHHCHCHLHSSSPC
jgi:hypothetical protein